MCTYLGRNLAQTLGCFPIFLLFLSIHKQIHICLKCEKSLNFAAAFVKIMETFVKTALNTLFAKSNNVPILQKLLQVLCLLRAVELI